MRKRGGGRGFDALYDHRPRRPGPSPPRAAGRQPFGASWWGAAWTEALEQRARLDPNRLPRGRTYARSGAVGELELGPGEVRADVQGSRREPYQVRVRVRCFSPPEWEQVLDALAAEIGHTAALLDGELPPEVADDVRSVGLDLLPGTGELQPRCSCPDWADPCKHAAAVCYLVADCLDSDPFGVLLLRGLGRSEVLAALRARRGLLTTDEGRVSPVDGGEKKDAGIPARAAFARAAAGELGALPAPPAPPRQAGRPTVLAADPPPGSGIDLAALRALASDAAARALLLARGSPSSGLELDEHEDLARRAAAVLEASGGAVPAGTGAPAAPGGPGLAELARRSGVPARELVRRALAFRDGGPGGLAVLDDAFSPEPGTMAAGRATLGESAVVRRNRVTLGDRQIRLGRDGIWYPFRKDRGGAWQPDGGPVPVAPGEPEAGTLQGDDDSPGSVPGNS